MTKVFTDPVTGELGPLPWSAEHAKKVRSARYMDRNGCEECKKAGGPFAHTQKARYVEGDACVACLHRQLTSDAPTLTPRSEQQARALGIPYYYASPTGWLDCPRGPHARKTDVETGKCLNCEAAQIGDGRETAESRMSRENPNMVISRKDAQAVGLKRFRTGEPCHKGHRGWRYTYNGACIECLRGVPEAPPERPVPDVPQVAPAPASPPVSRVQALVVVAKANAERAIELARSICNGRLENLEHAQIHDHGGVAGVVAYLHPDDVEFWKACCLPLAGVTLPPDDGERYPLTDN